MTFLEGMRRDKLQIERSIHLTSTEESNCAIHSHIFVEFDMDTMLPGVEEQMLM